MGLLKHFLGIGEVVAGVVVLGGEFEGFLIVVDSLLELLQSLAAVFFLEAGLQVTVAAVVEYLATLVGVEVGLLQGAVVVLDGFVVLLLPVEGVAEVVLGTVGGAVVVQGAAVVHFGPVVALCLVFPVSLAGLFAHGAALCRHDGEENQKVKTYS